MMSEILKSYNLYMVDTFNNNEMLIGMVTTMVLSMLIYILKSTPVIIYNFILKHGTRTIRISTDTNAFSAMTTVMEEAGVLEVTRSYKLINGRWGWDKHYQLSLGLGGEWYFINGTLVYIQLYKEPNIGDRLIETMFIRTLGRGNRFISEIVEAGKKINSDDDKTRIYRIVDNNVVYYSKQPKYKIHNMVLSDKAIKFYDNVVNFIESEDRYLKNGMAWKYSALLSGVHGTGKTQLIKCIAGETGWDILEIKSLSDFQNLNKVEAKTIVAIEEIDRLMGLSKNSNNDNVDISTDGGSLKALQSMSLASILTSLDGLCELYGVIVIATTNNEELLDKALTRDGRLDEHVYFDYMTREEFIKYYQMRYDNVTLDTDVVLKNDITGSSLEKMFKLGLNKEQFIEEFTVKE